MTATVLAPDTRNVPIKTVKKWRIMKDFREYYFVEWTSDGINFSRVYEEAPMHIAGAYKSEVQYFSSEKEASDFIKSLQEIYKLSITRPTIVKEFDNTLE